MHLGVRPASSPRGLRPRPRLQTGPPPHSKAPRSVQADRPMPPRPAPGGLVYPSWNPPRGLRIASGVARRSFTPRPRRSARSVGSRSVRIAETVPSPRESRIFAHCAVCSIRSMPGDRPPRRERVLEIGARSTFLGRSAGPREGAHLRENVLARNFAVREAAFRNDAHSQARRTRVDRGLTFRAESCAGAPGA
jgi:hypothetical protein